MPNGLSRGNFGQGLPPVQVIFKNLAAIGRDRKGLFGLYKWKMHFFGKKLLKIYYRPICALAVEWATKQCCILDAVAPFLRIDNWKKLPKTPKMAHRKWSETLFPVWRLEQSRSKYTYPTSPTVFYNSVVHTRGATTSHSKDIITFLSKKYIFGYLTGQKGGKSPHTGEPEKSRLLRFLIISKYVAPQKV